MPLFQGGEPGQNASPLFRHSCAAIPLPDLNFLPGCLRRMQHTTELRQQDNRNHRPGRFSRWPGFCAFGALLVAGCTETEGLSFASSRTQDRGSETTEHRQIAFAGGDVQLVPPRGYCIDPRSVRRGPENGFALIARCDRFGISGFFGTRKPALISVTVSNRHRKTPPTMNDLENAVGTADVLARNPGPDLPLIQVRPPENGFAGADSIQWRGTFQVNGHMVALGLYAPARGSNSASSGAGLLQELTRRTRAASVQ